MMNEDEAIREFLGDRPEATQFREWREVLQRRLASLEADRKKAVAIGGPGSSAGLDGRIAQLRKQIDALLEEEAVTQFVEDSVRVTLAMGAAAETVGDPDD
jgi:hypothetical protein